MKLAGIVDKDTAVGLRLAGIQDLYVPEDNTLEIWNKILDRDDIGIVLITEHFAEKIAKYLDDYRIRNSIPIIVEIPDKKGRIPDHVDYVSHLIKKAVGLEVNK